jgi:hypothetical protein
MGIQLENCNHQNAGFKGPARPLLYCVVTGTKNIWYIFLPFCAVEKKCKISDQVISSSRLLRRVVEFRTSHICRHEDLLYPIFLNESTKLALDQGHATQVMVMPIMITTCVYLIIMM